MGNKKGVDWTPPTEPYRRCVEEAGWTPREAQLVWHWIVEGKKLTECEGLMTRAEGTIKDLAIAARDRVDAADRKALALLVGWKLHRSGGRLDGGPEEDEPPIGTAGESRS